MHKAIAASVVLALVTAGCASSTTPPAASASSENSAKPATAPEILIVQTTNLPAAARYVDSPIPVTYALRVENRAAEPITLKRVTVQSVSEGAYYLAPTSRPFDVTIGPAQRQEVQVQVTAQPGRSVVGANGPVSLRVTCNFEGPNGKFQEVVMRRVNERTDITGQ